jgi:hypothetical protein
MSTFVFRPSKVLYDNLPLSDPEPSLCFDLICFCVSVSLWSHVAYQARSSWLDLLAAFAGISMLAYRGGSNLPSPERGGHLKDRLFFFLLCCSILLFPFLPCLFCSIPSMLTFPQNNSPALFTWRQPLAPGRILSRADT